MLTSGLSGGLSRRLSDPLGGSIKLRGSSAPSVPTTDLIQALPYPNGGTLPTWLATVGGNGTCSGTITDTGTGLQNPTGSSITMASFGPTANKPFTLVRVFKYSATWIWNSTNDAGTSYFASFSGVDPTCYVLSTNGGFLGGFPTSPNTSGYIVERFRRNTAGTIYYQTSGKAEVQVATGAGAYLFPMEKFLGYNDINFLSFFLYSGDAGDLTESGAWTQLASWISTNNFGASL